MIKELLIVQDLNLIEMMEEYRLFFLSLIPSVFLIAVFIEYFDRVEPFILLKRVFISVLLMTSVTTFYYSSIDASMKVADSVLKRKAQNNVLLTSMFKGPSHLMRAGEKKGISFINYVTKNLFVKVFNKGFSLTIYF